MSILPCPLLREGRAIGAIAVLAGGAGVQRKQIALLKTFADQAVIAIENVRLFNETKEALERQTATADILKVISGSPTDVQPVFRGNGSAGGTLCGRRTLGFVLGTRRSLSCGFAESSRVRGIAQLHRAADRPRTWIRPGILDRGERRDIAPVAG